jgi:ABC-type dipeptide/oligopeptide/nickel transport system permease component
LYDAVLASDVTLVAGCVVAGACCLAIGNFLTDIVRAIVDPRAAESV